VICMRKRRPVPRGAVLRLAGIAALVAAALLFSPPPAGAATYTVESCTNGSISGWAPFYYGNWSAYGNSCGAAGGALLAVSSTAPNAAAGWMFTAPPDTEIAGFRLTRSYSLPANTPFGTGVVTTITGGQGNGFRTWEPNFGGVVSAGPHTQSAAGMSGQTTLTAQVDCGGGASCTGASNLAV
jgi:hypothetical protein